MDDAIFEEEKRNMKKLFEKKDALESELCDVKCKLEYGYFLSENYEKAYNLLEPFVEEVFTIMQEHLNVENGDISPDDTYKLHKLEKEISKLIVSILIKNV